MLAMQVIPGVHQITHRFVNIVLFVEERLTLIDSGFRGSAPRIAEYIGSLGRSVREIELIIITHNHLDHVGGLAELKEMAPQASVAAHKDDLSRDEIGLPYPGYALKLLKLPLVSLLRPLAYIKPDDVDIRLGGGEVLPPMGGLEVIHTPGHTPGSICLFSPERKLLVVGDILNNRHRDIIPPARMISTDFQQAMESVKRLAQLDFDNLCCGHGKPMVGGAGARVRDWVKLRGF
ncbi:MAG TPA: MBL fold metallo-hydrolase [Dehalococcoidia bacterium]|nr:MBL fold metallo-hydrolase [Dehalococcoidia bacterium]